VPYYLGIDGGGSKTTSAIGDETSLLATATSGPSNVIRVGEAQARESLHQSVQQACATAGITPAQIAHTCIGAAGAARPEVVAILRRSLAEILSSPIDVVGDTQIALEAAFDEGPGVIVIAGTGSIAYGRDALGRTARAGGWGFAISDEGSAHWIGRTAISQALRAHDQSPDNPTTTVLLTALQKAWSINSLDDLIRAANATPAPDFSKLFPAILANATEGNEWAQQVCTRAGRELAQIAEVVIRRLFPKNSNFPAQDVPLAMAGGVFRHAPSIREVFYNEIRKQDSRAALKTEIVTPVEGALNQARKATGHR
jgi:glucosamine kinase